jgi:LysM repeat protein
VATTATTTSLLCSQGAPGWVKGYVVKYGDTFFSIATRYYTTASLLKSVNCRNSNLLYTGETLWVPNVVVRTAYPTSIIVYPTQLPADTVTPYPTEPLTETALPFTLTVEPAEPAAAISAIMASPTAIPTPK